jgi:hypothetical protein
MKNKFLILSALLLTTLSCKTKTDQKLTVKDLNDYKYVIEGYVMTPKGLHTATFYTDTFNIVNQGCNLEYQNSDGTIQTIYSPFKVSHIK